uniref:Uncharacterized protein n=1 Tax=viral metagenome TaxID=1070528 RepID=A0A6H2A4F1_9ZZZZ
MVTQLNFFLGEAEAPQKVKIKRTDLINQLTEKMTDDMTLHDLESYFRDDQSSWLGTLTDRELQEQYEEQYGEFAPIIEN